MNLQQLVTSLSQHFLQEIAKTGNPHPEVLEAMCLKAVQQHASSQRKIKKLLEELNAAGGEQLSTSGDLDTLQKRAAEEVTNVVAVFVANDLDAH